MKKEIFNKLFKEHYHPFFKASGFVPYKHTCFRRKTNDVEQTVVFAPTKTKEGTICSSAGFNIRIAEIENLWRADEDFPTVGMPLHLLRPDRAYYLWEFVKEDDLIAGKEIICGDMRAYGLPFLERFKDSTAVFKALANDSPANWFMCTEDYRDALLVAFACLREGKTAAMKRAEELLLKYQNKHPKYSIQLRQMHAILQRQ